MAWLYARDNAATLPRPCRAARQTDVISRHCATTDGCHSRHFAWPQGCPEQPLSRSISDLCGTRRSAWNCCDKVNATAMVMLLRIVVDLIYQLIVLKPSTRPRQLSLRSWSGPALRDPARASRAHRSQMAGASNPTWMSHLPEELQPI